MDPIKSILEKLETDGMDLEGETSFPVLGDNVLVTIALSGSNEPHSSQVDTLNWFHNSIQSLYPEIEKTIYDYYMASLPNYHIGLGELSSELMPSLKDKSEVWKYVTEPGIYIFPENEGGDLHLEYECTFDVDHGLRVKFVDRKLSGVGID